MQKRLTYLPQYTLSLSTALHLCLSSMATLHASVVQRSCFVCQLNQYQNNVLLDHNYTVRLGDFGFASAVGDTPEALSYLQWSSWGPGAVRWAAPEHFLVGDIKRTTKSDIYSLGNLIFLVSSPFITRVSALNFYRRCLENFHGRRYTMTPR